MGSVLDGVGDLLGPFALEAMKITPRLTRDVGAVATVTATLPPATVGREYWFVRKNAAQLFHIDPNGLETIDGGGAGKFLILDTDGESVALKCVFDGFWNIIASNGILSFQ